jgi:hypothetical protein
MRNTFRGYVNFLVERNTTKRLCYCNGMLLVQPRCSISQTNTNTHFGMIECKFTVCYCKRVSEIYLGRLSDLRSNVWKSLFKTLHEHNK